METVDWYRSFLRLLDAVELDAVRLLRVIGDIDLTELLPNVAGSTLVVHSRGDARVPFEHGLLLARTT